MARALIARAQERAAWIGDDHGDPYEEALNTGTVPIAVHVALKEFLDHLRSALDYCAHEICEAATGTATNAPIYFPIAARGFKPEDFASRVGKLMPGLIRARPDLVPVLAGFQPFAAQENGWLADLATLANRTKHVELTVNGVDAADLTVQRDANGKMLFQIRRPDGKQLRAGSLARIEAPHGLEGPGCKLIHLYLAPIEQELLTFMRPALAGVPRILGALAEAL